MLVHKENDIILQYKFYSRQNFSDKTLKSPSGGGCCIFIAIIIVTIVIIVIIIIVIIVIIIMLQI